MRNQALDAASCACSGHDAFSLRTAGRVMGGRSPPTAEDKNPSRINDLGLLLGPFGTSGDAPGPRHMWSIITCPKPEHDTWVAPSISRAKS
jgi:hypothetical protein